MVGFLAKKILSFLSSSHYLPPSLAWSVFLSFFSALFLLSSFFWTSRGHRCRPFSLRFLPSVFIAHTLGSAIPLLDDFSYRVLPTHALLALSASQVVHKKTSNEFIRVCTRGDSKLTKLAYIRLEDILIRHRGDRLLYIPQ